MSARRDNLGDVLGDGEEHRELGGHFIEWGTVGWDGDTPDTVLSVGDGTSAATGCTLLNVTLFLGSDITQRPKAGKASGRRIRCQLPWTVSVLAPIGLAVVVVFPGGDVETPGNGIVIATALGGLLAPNWNLGDAALCAPSGYGNFVRTRADGRIELSTRTDDGNKAAVYSLIDPTQPSSTKPGLPGFYDVAPWGKQIFNATGWHLRTQWGACADFGGYSDGGLLESLGLTSTIQFRASSISLSGSTVKLGAGTGHMPVTLAPELAITLSAILTQLEAVNDNLAALATIVAAIPGAGAVTAITAACTLADTAIALLSGALSPASILPFAATTTNAL